MTKITEMIKRFFINQIKEFFNIYVDEEKIRESFGDEYVERFSNVNPATGKKMVSGAKVLTRIFIVLMIVLCVIVAVRMIIYF